MFMAVKTLRPFGAVPRDVTHLATRVAGEISQHLGHSTHEQMQNAPSQRSPAPALANLLAVL